MSGEYTNVPYPYPPKPEDKASVGFCVLSFLFGIVGIILFFVWRKETPRKAKFCLIWGIIGIACGIIISVVSVIFISAILYYPMGL